MKAKYARITERLEMLIEEGIEVARLERDSSVGPYIQESTRLSSWLVRVDNIIQNVFSEKSPHYQHFKREAGNGAQHSFEVKRIVGILSGGLDDLNNGFLASQENLVAGEVFDSVLEEAFHLLGKGYKDPAAVLARVVVEDALRRMCREAGMEENGRASQMNEFLRESGSYGKPMWRRVQVWLDIGNSAAHGQFDEYSSDDVRHMIEDVQRFVGDGF